MTESSGSLPSARTFYDEVGGAPTFTRRVARFYEGVRRDPGLAPRYPQDDWGGADEALPGVLVQYWRGPTTSSQPRGLRRLRMRHAPFAIGEVQRAAWLTHMRDAVDPLDLTPEQDATLWGYLEMAAFSMQIR